MVYPLVARAKFFNSFLSSDWKIARASVKKSRVPDVTRTVSPTVVEMRDFYMVEVSSILFRIQYSMALQE